MTQQSNSSINGRNPDLKVVDFFSIFVRLWREKWVIAVFVLFAIIIAGTYLFFAKEKWTSTAVITMPDAGQISGYTSAMDILTGRPTDISSTQQAVIGRFSSSFSALSEVLENQEQPEKLLIFRSIQGQNLPLKVSYQGDSPESAQKKLAEYIQKIDEQVAKELKADLAINIKMRNTDLQESLVTQEKVAQEQKDLRLQQIAQALKVAQDSDVKSPQVQQTQDVTQDTMFLLGAGALTSMIKNEKSRPLVYSGSYYQLRQSLLDLERINSAGLDIHAYRYVLKPNQPIRRDSPKRAITMILAVILGGMVGSGVVLVRDALRNYREKA